MRDGYPLNWRVYIGGMEYLRRDRAQEDIRWFRAVNYGTVGGDKATDWLRERSFIAGG